MNYDLLNILTPNNIIIFILIFARLSGLFVVAPIFSTYPIPIQVKIWFMAILSYIFFPYVLNISNVEIPTSLPVLIAYTVKEFLVGFTRFFIKFLILYNANVRTFNQFAIRLKCFKCYGPVNRRTNSCFG